MTDEEKAEDFIENKIDWSKGGRDIVKQAYCDGLAEGRKEEQEKTCYCKHIQNFEKENAELTAEIEKMKCCGNCIHYIWEIEDGLKYLCKVNPNNIYGVCDKWELAE